MVLLYGFSLRSLLLLLFALLSIATAQAQAIASIAGFYGYVVFPPWTGEAHCREQSFGSFEFDSTPYVFASIQCAERSALTTWIEQITRFSFVLCSSEPLCIYCDHKGGLAPWIAFQPTALPAGVQAGTIQVRVRESGWTVDDGVVQCRYITFPDRFDAVPVVSVTINHKNYLQSYRHDPTTAWVTTVTGDGFQVCVSEVTCEGDGCAHDGSLWVDWMATHHTDLLVDVAKVTESYIGERACGLASLPSYEEVVVTPVFAGAEEPVTVTIAEQSEGNVTVCAKSVHCHYCRLPEGELHVIGVTSNSALGLVRSDTASVRAEVIEQEGGADEQVVPTVEPATWFVILSISMSVLLMAAIVLLVKHRYQSHATRAARPAPALPQPGQHQPATLAPSPPKSGGETEEHFEGRRIFQTFYDLNQRNYVLFVEFTEGLSKHRQSMSRPPCHQRVTKRLFDDLDTDDVGVVTVEAFCGWWSERATVLTSSTGEGDEEERGVQAHDHEEERGVQAHGVQAHDPEQCFPPPPEAALPEQADDQRIELAVVEAGLECSVCMVGRKSVLFDPCHHLCVCRECSSKLLQCPLCKVQVTRRTKVWL